MDMVESKGSKVVPLSGYRKDMRFPAIAEVRAYWEALRDGRTAPFRSEVDPRGIERALEHAFVLERIAPQVARFRLAGMHLNDLMGMEVRGMPFTAFFTPAARPEVGRILGSVFAGPATAELTLAAETGFGKPAIEGRLLILPLRSDLGDVSRALGCLVTDGAIGRAPRRFDLSESLTRPIVATVADRGRPAVAAGPILPPVLPPVLPPILTPASGLAEAAAPFAGAAPHGARDRGHLRLVVSQD